MPQRLGITIPLLRVWMWALLVGAWSCVALLKPYPPFSHVPEIPDGLDAALSLAMALLVAMRINRAYERWWEARTMWGSLVNASRNLAIKVRELIRPDERERNALRNLLVAFADGLKDHLREDAVLAKLAGFEQEQAQPEHVPSHIVGRIYRHFHQWKQRGSLSEQQLWVLDCEARQLLDICGGCERIKATRMPISWRAITWQCIVVYLLVFPWGLVDDFKVWTIPLTVFVAYLVMAGEVVAHFVEEPFGCHEDHLDLDAICQTINVSVSEVLRDDGEARSDSE